MAYIERLVINDTTKADILYDEHIVRYRFVAPYVKNKQVLDIACGSGYGAAILAKAGAEVIGIDLDEAALAEAEKTYGSSVRFKQGDAAKIPLEDSSMDIITSFETIEHIHNYENFVQELTRVAKQDGLVFVSTPNKKVFGQKNPFHIKEFTKQEFTELLHKHFPFVNILDQKNGIASVISGPGITALSVNDTDSEALYFMAVCSKSEIVTQFGSAASINMAALEKRDNNPAWKAINVLYKFLQKLHIV